MPNKVKLEQYFEDLYAKSDYFKLVKRIGLDTSKIEFKNIGGEGRFSFDLTNMKEIQYEFQLDSEIEKRGHKISAEWRHLKKLLGNSNTFKTVLLPSRLMAK